MVPLIAVLVFAAAGPHRIVAQGESSVLRSLGAAPRPAFSLSFRARVVGGKTWHTAGAYYGRRGQDYDFAYVSFASPQTKAQIARLAAGQASYPAEQVMPGKYRMATWVSFELRVRPPLANLLVDGRLQCSGPARADAGTDVGLMAFDAVAEFKNVKLKALAPSVRVVRVVVPAPQLTECRTQAATSWGAYVDRVAKFADSDAGIKNARRDPQMGIVPPYVFHAVIDPGDSHSYDGAYPAFHHALFINAFLNCHRYYGGDQWLRRARQLADWNIAHSSPPDCRYPNLPYSTVWQGKMGGFQDRDGLMLDKVGWTGLAYLRVWEATGEAMYLEAARKIGQTLLAVQRKDGAWDFRVRLSSPVPTQRYTGNQVFNVQFLNGLAQVTGDRSYRAAADRAWAWLERGPLQSNLWEAFYEDVGPGVGSIGNWDAIEAGIELVRRGQIARAQRIADWVRGRFGIARNGRGIGVREQTAFMVPMNCHTLHWCRLLSALYKATGKLAYRQAAISAVNLCTANMWRDGRSPNDVFSNGLEGCWYSLTFSPLYLGLELMADFPDHAPQGENHILSSNKEPRHVKVGQRSLSYDTAALRDGDVSIERIKLRSEPTSVIMDVGRGWRWDKKNQLLTVKHEGGRVKITLAPAGR